MPGESSGYYQPYGESAAKRDGEGGGARKRRKLRGAFGLHGNAPGERLGEGTRSEAQGKWFHKGSFAAWKKKALGDGALAAPRGDLALNWRRTKSYCFSYYNVTFYLIYQSVPIG